MLPGITINAGIGGIDSARSESSSLATNCMLSPLTWICGITVSSSGGSSTVCAISSLSNSACKVLDSSSAAGMISVVCLKLGAITGNFTGNVTPSTTKPTSNSTARKFDSSISIPRSWISSKVNGREVTRETSNSSNTFTGTEEGEPSSSVSPVAEASRMLSNE